MLKYSCRDERGFTTTLVHFKLSVQTGWQEGRHSKLFRALKMIDDRP
jgi:hypothetical protein